MDITMIDGAVLLVLLALLALLAILPAPAPSPRAALQHVSGRRSRRQER